MLAGARTLTNVVVEGGAFGRRTIVAVATTRGALLVPIPGEIA